MEFIKVIIGNNGDALGGDFAPITRVSFCSEKKKAGRFKGMKHWPVKRNLRTAESSVERGDIIGRIGRNPKEVFSISQQNGELICADVRLTGLQTEFESTVPLCFRACKIFIKHKCFGWFNFGRLEKLGAFLRNSKMGGIFLHVAEQENAYQELEPYTRYTGNLYTGFFLCKIGKYFSILIRYVDILTKYIDIMIFNRPDKFGGVLHGHLEKGVANDFYPE